MTIQRSNNYEEIHALAAPTIDATRQYIAAVALNTRATALSLIRAHAGFRDTSKNVVRYCCIIPRGKRSDVWAPFFGTLTSLEVEEYRPARGIGRLVPTRLRSPHSTAITIRFARGLIDSSIPEQTSSISTEGTVESDMFRPTTSLLHFTTDPKSPDHPKNRDMSVVEFANRYVDQILTAATVGAIVDGAARGHSSVASRVEFPAGGNELLESWTRVSSKSDVAKHIAALPYVLQLQAPEFPLQAPRLPAA